MLQESHPFFYPWANTRLLGDASHKMISVAQNTVRSFNVVYYLSHHHRWSHTLRRRYYPNSGCSQVFIESLCQDRGPGHHKRISGIFKEAITSAEEFSTVDIQIPLSSERGALFEIIACQKRHTMGWSQRARGAWQYSMGNQMSSGSFAYVHSPKFSGCVG